MEAPDIPMEAPDIPMEAPDIPMEATDIPMEATAPVALPRAALLAPRRLFESVPVSPPSFSGIAPLAARTTPPLFLVYCCSFSLKMSMRLRFPLSFCGASSPSALSRRGSKGARARHRFISAGERESNATTRHFSVTHLGHTVNINAKSCKSKESLDSCSTYLLTCDHTTTLLRPMLFIATSRNLNWLISLNLEISA